MRYTTARFGETTRLLGKFTSGRRPAQSFTTVDTGANTADVASHGYVDGDGPHRLTTTNTLPGGLSLGTDYYLGSITSGTIAFYLTQADAIADTNRVDITSAGSGVHTISNPITLKLIDLSTGNLTTLITADCSELSTSISGGFSTYAWPTSNIAAQPTSQTEYLYLMTDAYTLREAEGKFVLGGFPDESARARYEHVVHIDPLGSVLPTIATMAAATLTFNTGAQRIVRATGSWVTDGFAAGQRVQITGSVLNDGVKGPVVSITTTTNPNDTLNFTSGILTEGPSAGIGVVAKSFTFDLGTAENPVNNLRDARQIADLLDFNTYHLQGAAQIDLDFDHIDWEFIGLDQNEDGVTVSSGASNAGSRFTRLGIFGALNGRMLADNCIIDGDSGTISGVQGIFTNCAFKDTIGIAAGGEIVGDAVASRSALSTFLDFSAGNCSFLAGSVQGVFTALNMTGGDLLGTSLAGTILVINPSCTGGTIQAIGYGEFTYAGVLGPTIIDQVLRGSRLNAAITTRSAPGDAMDLVANAVDAAALATDAVGEIADGVWDEPMAGHATPGTAGGNLDVPVSTRAQPGDAMDLLVQAVDAIWDEDIADHLSPPSTGRALNEVVNGVASRGVIDISTTPWREIRYAFDPLNVGDTAIHEIYELYDQDGVAISGDHTSGNNPLSSAGRMIAERRRV